ncbi:MAG: hypothetical protein OXG16_04420 [Rhodospirillales bacterium]|nr:hypothetical protein [Rhodospirillales bacterium]
MPRSSRPTRAELAASAAAAGIRKLRYRVVQDFDEEEVIGNSRPETDGSKAVSAYWRSRHRALKRVLLETARELFRKAAEREETAGGDPLYSVTLTWTPADDRCHVETLYKPCYNHGVKLGRKARKELRKLAGKVFAVADAAEDGGRFDQAIRLTVDTPSGLPTELVSDPGDVCQDDATYALAAAAARHLRKRRPDWQELDHDGIVDTYLRVKRKRGGRLKLMLLACPLTGVPVPGPAHTC